ncbi:MAG: hypothetical protein HOE11_04595 [Candidatus Diapherotrites archaeon]|jgi:hypothetical protein|nr:hypothetical protein [Candidatus Diapherotrites archaeon]MBT4596812.1 hypothetical protein [Candidatus Diapherotrites archaeon]
MKKIIIIALILVLSLFLGCTIEEPIPNDSKFDKLEPIPSECLQYANDECAVFSCMVNNCWCEQSPDAILKEGTQMFLDEARAKGAVQSYLNEQNISDYTLKNTAKLNDIFFNVFIEIDGDEEVFTVATNGTILKTLCGV